MIIEMAIILATTIFPSAPGLFSELTPVGDSPNYKCVDEVVPDLASTYVNCPLGVGTLDDLYSYSEPKFRGYISRVEIFASFRLSGGFLGIGDPPPGAKGDLITAIDGVATLVPGATPMDIVLAERVNTWTSPRLVVSLAQNPSTGKIWRSNDFTDLQVGVRATRMADDPEPPTNYEFQLTRLAMDIYVQDPDARLWRHGARRWDR